MSEFLDSPDYFIAVFCILLLKYFFFSRLPISNFLGEESGEVDLPTPPPARPLPTPPPTRFFINNTDVQYC